MILPSMTRSINFQRGLFESEDDPSPNGLFSLEWANGRVFLEEGGGVLIPRGIRENQVGGWGWFLCFSSIIADAMVQMLRVAVFCVGIAGLTYGEFIVVLLLG
ncbi:hypothetical protein CDAR_535471 [Caerostris darwini]|uniref:Uncharacterized protein n=1 Tax=Caerostris darwini TaxID=1538125 RepID=A0AAV4V294_9ARAC|nr:hypothetical protein CDAR_535471 [Caerostris darwini]